MTTYKDIAYMILDELQISSDDSTFNINHIAFLIDKYRSLLLKKYYSDVKKSIPESNYQTICLNLEVVNGIDGDDCSNTYLRSVETIPNTLDISTPRVSSMDFLGGEITYVSRERMKFVGHNKFLSNILYCCIGPKGKLYIKSANPQSYYLDKVELSGIFEEASEAAKLSCNETSEEDITEDSCDPMNNRFPLEEALIPVLIESVVKELLSAAYRPSDDVNNANDDLSDLIAFIRRNTKSNLAKQIEG